MVGHGQRRRDQHHTDSGMGQRTRDRRTDTLRQTDYRDGTRWRPRSLGCHQYQRPDIAMLTDKAVGLRSWLRPNSFGSRRHRDGLDIGGGKHLTSGRICAHNVEVNSCGFARFGGQIVRG